MNKLILLMQIPLIISILFQIFCFFLYWSVYKITLKMGKAKLQKGDEFGKMLLFLIVIYSVTVLPFTNTLDFKQWIGFFFIIGEALVSYLILRFSYTLILTSYAEIPNNKDIIKQLNISLIIVFVIILILKFSFLILNYFYNIYEKFLIQLGFEITGLTPLLRDLGIV